jgi:hypothetical protein
LTYFTFENNSLYKLCSKKKSRFYPSGTNFLHRDESECFNKKNWLKTKATSQRDVEKLLKKALAWKFQCHVPLIKKDVDFKKGRRLMFKNRLLEALKNKNSAKSDKVISSATKKIDNQKRLSSQEFLKVHEAIWQDGPKIKYQSIGSMEKLPGSINQNPTLWSGEKTRIHQNPN